MLFIIAIFFLLALWIFFEFLTAPSGYEDENGFHNENPLEQKVHKTAKKEENENQLIIPIIS